MKKIGTAAAATFVILLLQVPASQAVTPAAINMYDTYFSPSVQTVAGQAASITWTNNSSYTTHRSVQDGPLLLWDTGDIFPLATSGIVSADWAGSFPYHCFYHPVYMKGTIKVPVQVFPVSGTPSTSIQIDAGAVTAPAGDVYEIQSKKGLKGNWVRLMKSANSSLTRTFARGSYKIRSRVVVLATSAASGWSPIKALKIT